MAFTKFSGSRYGKRSSKRAAPAKTVSKISSDAPYPRTFEPWLLKDDKTLVDGIEAGFDLYDLASMLDREPVSVLNRLNAVGVFEFEPGSEEQIEIFAFGLSGVPLVEAVRWCSADPQRLLWSALDAMRKLPDPKLAIELALRHRLWRLTAADLDDLYWLATQDEAAVSVAVATVLERYDAPTPRTVRDQMNGVTAQIVPSTYWSSVAQRSAEVEAASRTCEEAPSGNGNGRKSASARGWGKRYGKRGCKSPSVPSGAPARDIRTAAERAWESKTHW